MKINEIFYSIQGEGLWAGMPNIFIRTTGCNLRCSYCDTTYAYDAGNIYTIEQIMKQLSFYPCMYLCITGGEPLLQPDIYSLVDAAFSKKYHICIETNGSRLIKQLCNKPLLISLDVKCPSSNMQSKMHLDNLSYLRDCDQLKFIIGTDKDYTYACEILATYEPHGTIFFQPVWGTDTAALAKKILNDKLSVRLGLQFHKILFGDCKGV